MPLFLLLQVSNMYKTNRQLFDLQLHKQISAAAFKKSKTSMVVQMLLFFVSAYVTHSLVEKLSVLTALLGNKDKNPENVEV